ncbi:hydrogenase maturation nickel metallochaperone HypA [Limisalsivibrio acetivorans]|uniref:hydrogenase maturation nickel metallochaperone HypA n=1 Tax=Limisalsivibrio acetivorans TaxID=1304888 RepID=UPI0003B7A8E6|nr:hydrogenase maturation nickel metallochaperone HypA [Limisalsivibrio acetivorans]
MHEASIAQSLMEIVFDTARANNAGKITKVFVRIGRLQAVENDALLFAFDALKEETMAEDAEMIIEDVGITGKCKDCGKVSEFEAIMLHCPHCASYAVELLTGEELAITEIEID